jgi:hypothetical protein
MPNNNMIAIKGILKSLERRKMTCEWSEVEAIQTKIDFYNNKLANGIQHEPAF